jgi:predicted homoserine dehydrogenase-like protein
VNICVDRNANVQKDYAREEQAMSSGLLAAHRASELSIASGLAQRAEASRPVRVGLVGSGEMGTDIVTQVAQMPGLEIVVIADIDPSRAFTAVTIAGYDRDKAKSADSPSRVSETIGRRQIAVVPHFDLVCRAEAVEVVIDATGNPNVGAELALTAIEQGKHIVMMNVEADVTVGAYLRSQADKASVVYTLGAGDEPVATMELVNFVRSLGYPVVAAGKGKNNPLKIDATPDAYEEEARRRNMNPRMLVEFVDGSKTMVEMVALANATGLVPDKPGMHGPAATLAELHRVLCPKEDGGLLSRRGVVDFSVGRGVAPGVFVIAEMRHPRVRERMHDLHLGEGPYYTFYRPYHLTSLEVPLSAAAAVLFGQAHMAPLPVPSAEVGAVAKKDLPPGARLDAIGEYCYRGFALSREDALARKALPLGLAQGATTIKAIRAGDTLTYENCRPDENLTIAKVRRKQDEMVARIQRSQSG